MAVTCPACNKANQGEPICQRCGCDLAVLHTIVGAAAAHLRSALGGCERQEWLYALDHAGRSWRLCHSIETARLAFLAAAAAGDTRQALLWHDRAQAGAETSTRLRPGV